ncbi:proprotein convertase P-domain-containing protein [Candidatus Sumerlaeota bacterium]|nr:proprotein convertase P-domain-containing protein [Candidatus Sumerlaeota bacterium]
MKGTILLSRKRSIFFLMVLCAISTAAIHAGSDETDESAVETRFDKVEVVETATAPTEPDNVAPPLGRMTSEASGRGPHGLRDTLPPPPPGMAYTTEVYTNAANIAIPDDGWVEFYHYVSGLDPCVWDASLTVFITHTRNSDLLITLTSPAGTSVTLSSNNGGGFDNVFNGTLFDDDAGGVSAPGPVTDVAYADLVVSTVVVPEEALAAFIGENPNGTWRARVSDTAAGEQGRFRASSLRLTTLPSAPQNTTTSVVSLTGLGLPILDHTTTLQDITVGALDEFICDVDLATSITHTFNWDLDIWLKSPAGTTVTISSRNGSGFDDVFNGTLWDDSAGATNYPGAVTDYTGWIDGVVASPLCPEEAMGAFIGENPNGQWTLTVHDNAGADQGALDGLALRITTCAANELRVSKRAGRFGVDLGTPFEYLVEMTNAGTTDSSGVRVVDTLPPAVEYVSDTAGVGPPTAGVWTWDTGDVGPGGTLSCHVAVAPIGPAPFTNTVTLTDYPIEPDLYDNQSQALDVGVLVGPADYPISAMGADGSTVYGASSAAIAYSETSDRYLVVWSGDHNSGALADEEFEIFGRMLNGDGSPAGDMFRLSDMGPDGDPSAGAYTPAVAWNSAQDRFLVVWSGDDASGAMVDDEIEIFGQVVSASGSQIGSDYRISIMGPDGDPAYGAFAPCVVFNTATNQYLIAWHGDDDTAPLVDDEFEIFIRRADYTGAPVGGMSRISDMGNDGATTSSATNAAVAWDSVNNQYLVVWQGDDGTPPLADGEIEIWGQLLNSAGTQIGSDTRLTAMGGASGDTTTGAYAPSVAYGPTQNRYLVVWHGDESSGGYVDGEFEIWGQRLDGNGAPAGLPFSISNTGELGDPDGGARNPSVVYNGDLDEFVVVWDGQILSSGTLVAYNETLHDNGPILNSPGTGSGGFDESILRNNSLGMNTYGFGHQVSAGYRVADDFTIDDPRGWQIEEIVFYAHQTGATTETSTMTDVNYRIWDGSPDNPGSHVVYGDTTTNRLAGSTWSGVYRVTETSSGTDTSRPIMASTARAGVILPPGTYWLDWQCGGSLASGPWADPIAVDLGAGSGVTGNALQWTGAWAPALDTGTGTPQQGFPFQIVGRPGPETNGPIANSLGTGVGGFDESILLTPRGMGLYGYGHQNSAGNRIADDFTIPDPQGWRIDEVVFYAYQTGATNSEITMTEVNYRIWDGPPGEPGSNVIFGDTSTNRLAQSAWSETYRVTDVNSGADATRPIMANTVACGAILPPGSYWLDWQTSGSLSYTGPWAPPIALDPGAAGNATGNGMQSTDNGVTWNPVFDGAPSDFQGFPFLISARLANETDVFGQRLDAATGAEVGIDDFRISDMGPDYDTAYCGFAPAAVYNPGHGEALVVWEGDDNRGGLIDDEFEIFGQRLFGGPEISVSPMSLDFGMHAMGMGPSAESIAHVLSIGVSDLAFTGGGFSITGANAGDFALSSTPPTTPLGPGAQLDVGIVFEPTATGARSALLEIATNDADEPVAQVPLSGTGTPAPVVVTDIDRPGYSTDILYAGKRVYNDRTYEFTNPIPDYLEGELYIKTLDADRDLITTDSFLSFNVGEEAFVYVGIANNMPTPPSWLDGWEEMPERLRTDISGKRRVFKKAFAAGRVYLGPNREEGMPTGYRMYSVVITHQPLSADDWMLYR